VEDRRRILTGARCLVGGAAIALTLALGACGGGGGEAATSGPTADLRITRDHGHRLLASYSGEPLPAPRTTILELLRGQEEVTTATYFEMVASIDGLREQREGDDPTRWVTNVNGIESDIQAIEYLAHPGDMIQFDLAHWDTSLTTRATVGAFPQTFTRGMFGERFPVTLRCERPESGACRRVDRRLRAAGVRPDGSPPPSPSIPAVKQPEIPNQVLRAEVRVGAWPQLRKRRFMDRIAGGPRDSGVFARFSAAGDRLWLLDPTARRRRAEGAGTGLVAAVKPTSEDLVWVVTGVDEAGVERASRALSSTALLDAYAVAVTADGVQKIPLVDDSP
jgi:hypothetical protein